MASTYWLSVHGLEVELISRPALRFQHVYHDSARRSANAMEFQLGFEPETLDVDLAFASIPWMHQSELDEANVSFECTVYMH